jgi:hypothetical protein
MRLWYPCARSDGLPQGARWKRGESSSRDAADRPPSLCVACRPVAAAWRHIGHLVADRQTSPIYIAAPCPIGIDERIGLLATTDVLSLVENGSHRQHSISCLLSTPADVRRDTPFRRVLLCRVETNCSVLCIWPCQLKGWSCSATKSRLTGSGPVLLRAAWVIVTGSKSHVSLEDYEPA